METFFSQVLGTTDLPTYAAGLLLALIGAILSLRLQAQKRDPMSPNTPFKFSWAFLFRDNVQRLFTGFLLTFVAFRFSQELMNEEFNMWFAFLVGFFNDRVAGFVEKFELKARS